MVLFVPLLTLQPRGSDAALYEDYEDWQDLWVNLGQFEHKDRFYILYQIDNVHFCRRAEHLWWDLKFEEEIQIYEFKMYGSSCAEEINLMMLNATLFLNSSIDRRRADNTDEMNMDRDDGTPNTLNREIKTFKCDGQITLGKCLSSLRSFMPFGNVAKGMKNCAWYAWRSRSGSYAGCTASFFLAMMSVMEVQADTSTQISYFHGRDRTASIYNPMFTPFSLCDMKLSTIIKNSIAFIGISEDRCFGFGRNEHITKDQPEKEKLDKFEEWWEINERRMLTSDLLLELFCDEVEIASPGTPVSVFTS